jgi:hypothetical protein
MEIKIESIVVRGSFYEVGFKINDDFTVFRNVQIEEGQTEEIIIEKAWIAAKKEAEIKAANKPIEINLINTSYTPPDPKPVDIIITPFDKAAYVVDQYGDIMDAQPKVTVTGDRVIATYGEIITETTINTMIGTDGGIV